MSKVLNSSKSKKATTINARGIQGVGNEVDYIVKLLESLPQDAKQKAFLELRNRLSLDAETPIISTTNGRSKVPEEKTAKISKNAEISKITMAPTRRSSRMANKSNLNKIKSARQKEPEPYEEIILPHSPFPQTPYIDNDENDDGGPIVTEVQCWPEIAQPVCSIYTSSSKEVIPYSVLKKQRMKFIQHDVAANTAKPMPVNNVSIDPKIVNGCFVPLQRILALEIGLSRSKKRMKKISNDGDYVPPKKRRRNSNLSIKQEKISDNESSSSESKYNCRECNKQFHSYNGYRCHMYRHTGNLPFMCQYCGKQFPLKFAYESHIRRHEQVKPFSCKMCDYRSVNKIDLVMHSMIHSETKRFNCDSCGKGFANKTRLNTHVTFVHNKDKLDILVCHICGFQTKSKYSLNRHHVITHTDKEKFQCPICLKVLIQKPAFKTHLRSHTGVGLYDCGVCEKKCTSKALLDLHTKTHQDAIFECSQCLRKFKSESQLTQHQLIHEKKPFHCTHCGYECTMKANFTKHMRNMHNDPEYAKTKNLINNSDAVKENSKSSNPQLVEKGLVVLEELLKETASATGKEYSVEELKELEMKRQSEKIIRTEKTPLEHSKPRKRGRPPNNNKTEKPPAKRRETSVILTKEVIESLNAKYMSSIKGKESSAEAKRIADLCQMVDLSQYVFQVEDEQVDVPIEVEEDGKKVKMIIIELKGDEDDDDEDDEDECKMPEKAVEVEHILTDSIEIMGKSFDPNEVHEVHLIPNNLDKDSKVNTEENINGLN